jgi:hypothetical protein
MTKNVALHLCEKSSLASIISIRYRREAPFTVQVGFEIVHVEVAMGFEPVLRGLDG